MKIKCSFYLCAVLVGFSGCKTTSVGKIETDKLEMKTQTNFGTIFATAELKPKSGSAVVGKAFFAKSKDGIQVFVRIDNASPGFHGIHIHEKGDCSAKNASSAGAHFDPTGLPHGAPDPKMHHIGDLGNIVVGKNGHAVLNLAIPNSRQIATFSWDDIIGKALILHSGIDDLESQPSGNAGIRIGCGVINRL